LVEVKNWVDKSTSCRRNIQRQKDNGREQRSVHTEDNQVISLQWGDSYIFDRDCEISIVLWLITVTGDLGDKNWISRAKNWLKKFVKRVARNWIDYDLTCVHSASNVSESVDV